MDMRIDSKAPTRVDLAGGTLDIWPLYLFHPGAVTVNAAITRYASCRIETHAQADHRIRLISRDTEREESFASFADLVKAKRYKLPLLAELERRLVLCYTGNPRKSAINNWDVFRAHIGGNKAIFHNLARISEVAQQLRGALERSNWTEAGRLMREEWSFRKRNLPTITTQTIDRIVDGTPRTGALAGQVCGAGAAGGLFLPINPQATEPLKA